MPRKKADSDLWPKATMSFIGLLKSMSSGERILVLILLASCLAFGAILYGMLLLSMLSKLTTKFIP